MNIQNINLKLFIPSIAVIVIAIILIFTHSTFIVINYAGCVLSFYHELAYVFAVIATVCCVCYYVNTKKTNIKGKDLFIHNAFGPVLDSFFSAITYGMAFHTAIIMLNGIFKQHFYDYEFIKDIGYGELYIIAAPMICLLFWSVSQVYELGTVAYSYSGATSEIISAEDKPEGKNALKEDDDEK